MAEQSPTSDFRLGGWIARPQLGRIDRGDERVHVTPRAMAVLLRLASANGEVVSRSELLDAIWPRMAVTPDALTQCIVELRKAFGDSPRSPTVIETIPKIGLRLLVPVTSVTAVPTTSQRLSALEPSVSEPARSPTGRENRTNRLSSDRQKRWRLAALWTTALVVILGSWLLWQSKAPRSFTSTVDALDGQRGIAFSHLVSGNRYFNRNNDRQSMVRLAVRQYELATEADPGFPLAWAQLGMARTALIFLRIDATASQARKAEAAIARALKLDPDLGEAHLARANYLHRVLGDTEAAMAEFDIAEPMLPHSADLYFSRASLQRRLGAWDGAKRDLNRALEIDAANVLYLRQQFVNYLFTRDYDQAVKYLDRVRELAPDDTTVVTDRALLDLMRSGDTVLANLYESILATDERPQADASFYVRWLAAIFDRDYAKATDVLDRSPGNLINDVDSGNTPLPKDLFYARTLQLDGKLDEARDRFAAAERRLDVMLASEQYRDPLARSFCYLTLAEAQAAQGRSRDALESLRQAARVPSKSSGSPGSSLQRLATVIRVLVPLGDAPRALAELDDYLGGAGTWAVEALARDPRLDSIRGDPKFGELMRKYRRL